MLWRKRTFIMCINMHYIHNKTQQKCVHIVMGVTHFRCILKTYLQGQDELLCLLVHMSISFITSVWLIFCHPTDIVNDAATPPRPYIQIPLVAIVCAMALISLFLQFFHHVPNNRQISLFAIFSIHTGYSAMVTYKHNPSYTVQCKNCQT